MQNILAPQSEARNTVKAYKNAGGLDNEFVLIPVFPICRQIHILQKMEIES